MIRLIFILLLFCGHTAFSQHTFTTVDRAAVEKAVTDASSPTYYPKLIERFNAFDTTLTAMDYRLLYYGFAFQKEYNGYMDHKSRDINKAINEKKFDEAMQLCDAVLQKSPISLEANNKKGLAIFSKDQNDPMAMKYGMRYQKLMRAILESGDGQSCKTAFKTLYVTDEYNVMTQILRVKGVKSQALQGFCDVMTIEPSEYYKNPTVYFDTYESLASMQKMFKQ